MIILQNHYISASIIESKSTHMKYSSILESESTHNNKKVQKNDSTAESKSASQFDCDRRW